MTQDELTGDLERLLGPDGVLTDPTAIASRSADLQRLFPGKACAVVRPVGTEEVATTVRYCADHGIPIVPLGGNTGLCGGAAPDGSGTQLVLSLERMRAVREIDLVGDFMVVEAGVTLTDAVAAAREKGRLLPISHGGRSSQIGGNLSTNAGGNNVLRYGMARSQVLGLEVVLPDGRILNALRSLRKDNTGYDLKQLFIGAEGSLGIITAAALRVAPAPRQIETILIALTNPDAASRVYRVLMEEIGELVSAFELIPGVGLELIPNVDPDFRPPFEESHAWHVLVEITCSSARLNLRDALLDIMDEVLENRLAQDAVLAESESQRERLWKIRENLAIAHIEDTSSLKNDTSVPIAAIPEFIRRATEAVERRVPGVRPIPFGHMGDGNIHFNLMRPWDMSPSDFQKQWPGLSEDILELSAELHGSISAEHGLGQLKGRYLPLQKSDVEIELMQRIKAAIDPQLIMNPGKVVPVAPQ